MEVSTSEGTATPEISTESTAVAEVSSPAGNDSAATSTQAGEPSAAPASAFVPNYKFKVMDKEHEIDEFIRPAIKSAEHEKKLKEIYEKAFGLDEVKAGRDKVRQEYQTYKTQTEPMVNTIREAANLYQSAIQAAKSGNNRKAVFQMEEAFKHLGIDDGVLKNYVFQKLQVDELDPQQKAYYNQHRELELQNAQMQKQMQEYQKHAESLAVQTRTTELNTVFNQPEISQIVQAFDSRNGQGAFQQEVILRGQQIYNLSGRDASAAEVVSDIIKKYGLSPQTVNSEQAQSGAVAPQELPVIPAVRQASTSTVGKTISSVQDLMSLRKQKFGY
jgi:hypothetical protein